jgi:LacI family transcriptional regulator
MRNKIQKNGARSKNPLMLLAQAWELLSNPFPVGICFVPSIHKTTMKIFSFPQGEHKEANHQFTPSSFYFSRKELHVCWKCFAVQYTFCYRLNRSHHSMPQTKKTIALIFPVNVGYSQLLTAGVIERHLELRNWNFINLPRQTPGVNPLPEGNFPIDGAIVWSEPRDLYVKELVRRGIPVINCGMEWANEPGVVRVSPHIDDVNQKIITHFQLLGLNRLVILGHGLSARPGTHSVLQAMADIAQGMGMDALVRDIGGEIGPGADPRRLLCYTEEPQLQKLLQSLPTPSAIYCTGDYMGHLVCSVASHCGFRVPDDFAIMGGGGEVIGELSHPPLSSVLAPMRAIGRKAVDLMVEWISKGHLSESHVIVRGADLIERESTVGKSGRTMLAAIHRYIEKHAITGISINELVERSQLSAKTFNREYYNAFGIKPLDEVNQLRIAHARRLLIENKCTIGEVAQRCGFSSQAAFYNYFTRHTGMKPSQLIKTSSH